MHFQPLSGLQLLVGEKKREIFQLPMCISLSHVFRHSKPFNPLLGETFEYVRPDLGYYCITEQVSVVLILVLILVHTCTHCSLLGLHLFNCGICHIVQEIM